MTSYTKLDLQRALEGLPLEANDTVFVHSNLGYFGRMEGVGNPEELCIAFYNAIMTRIGPDGTLVVPTFTYSLCNGEPFHREQTASKMGMFSEWLRRSPISIRSYDPIYSVVASGYHGVTYTFGLNPNSFGEGSFFDLLYKGKGKILNLNFNAGSTFVHYVERLLKVPYRFDKEFTGDVTFGKCHLPDHKQTIYVRELDDKYIPDFAEFDDLARKHGMFKTSRLGRGEIGVISARQTYDLIAATLPRQPLFLTRGGRDA